MGIVFPIFLCAPRNRGRGFNIHDIKYVSEVIMPKLKSHSGAKKRFIVGKNGKVKHKKNGLRHLLTGMSPNRGRKLRRTGVLEPNDTKYMKKVLPYAW